MTIEEFKKIKPYSWATVVSINDETFYGFFNTNDYTGIGKKDKKTDLKIKTTFYSEYTTLKPEEIKSYTLA